MKTKLVSFLVTALIVALVSTPVMAKERHHRDGHKSHHRYSHHDSHRTHHHRSHRSSHNHHRYTHHHRSHHHRHYRRHHSDEAGLIIGGLILGAVINELASDDGRSSSTTTVYSSGSSYPNYSDGNYYSSSNYSGSPAANNYRNYARESGIQEFLRDKEGLCYAVEYHNGDRVLRQVPESSCF